MEQSKQVDVLELFNFWDYSESVFFFGFFTHVANCPHSASDWFSFRHFDGQPQVRNTNVSYNSRRHKSHCRAFQTTKQFE